MIDSIDLALAQLEAEDLDIKPVEDLGDDLVRFEDVHRRLEAERARRLGGFDQRNGHAVFGYTSAIAYLKDRCRMSGGRAKRLVGIARAARKFSQTFLSWKHNQISTDQAELLFKASERHPDKYPNAEQVLLEIVGDSYEETKKLLDYWRHTVDQPGMQVDEETQLLRRRLDYSRKANGMVEGEFALPQLAGESFITAIDALIPPPGEDDERTPTQRRADALEDLSRAYLEGTETPEVGGERPHMNVHVDIDALEGTPGGLHETETGHVLTVETVRQLACDSSLHRIVWNAESEIIDVGRRTRVISSALRRAVTARDRHCTHPGCDRDPRWCDVHHIQHWADGGETNLDNLRLTCRYHHTLIHQEEAQLVGDRRPT